MGGSARLSFVRFNSNNVPPDLSIIGFPYGSAGDLTDYADWTLVGGNTTPVMSVGPDSTTDWIQASSHSGTANDWVFRAITPPPIAGNFTFQFTHFYQPTTGQQDSTVEFDNAGGSNTVLGLDLRYTGTGAGSLTKCSLFDDVNDTGFLTITLLPGVANAIKVTYDGADVRLYVNTVLQMTWPNVLAVPGSAIAQASVHLRWVTGFGGDIFMKDLELHPGVI